MQAALLTPRQRRHPATRPDFGRCFCVRRDLGVRLEAEPPLEPSPRAARFLRARVLGHHPSGGCHPRANGGARWAIRRHLPLALSARPRQCAFGVAVGGDPWLRRGAGVAVPGSGDGVRAVRVALKGRAESGGQTGSAQRGLFRFHLDCPGLFERIVVRCWEQIVSAMPTPHGLC